MIDKPGPDPDSARARGRPTRATRPVPGKILTAGDIAELLGLASAAAARVEISRWRQRTGKGVRPLGRDAGTGAYLYWIGDVEKAREAGRPGRGARTDLHRQTSPAAARRTPGTDQKAS